MAVLILFLLFDIVLSVKDYSDCKWFGNTTNVPSYPVGVCSAHSHETELDLLWLYSTKMECNDNGELVQFEWNNTDCSGDPYNTQLYRKDDGYYFNCQAKTSCPFTKIVLWKLRDTSIGENNSYNSDHNDHICAYDTHAYHEISIVTNICIDLLQEHNVSFYIDCSAQKVTYEEFIDAECKTKINDFTITQGCDDPFNFNAYISIAECDDANYKQNTESHNHLAIIFTVIVAVIIIVLAIMIAATIIKRKSESQVNAANVQQDIQQPFNVDFQSIGDATDEPKSTQDIITEGKDIQEIPIYN